MKKMVALILRKIGNIFYVISNRISDRSKSNKTPSLQSIRVIKWFEDQGDKNHRINYSLNDESIVFDLGGYEGEWSAQILCLYGSFIYIFEPYEEYFKNIQNRFLHNKKVRAFQFGLSNNNQLTQLSIDDNSSSIFIESDNSVNIRLVDSKDFFSEYNILKIDLMKINIEGGEYDLLEHLISTGDVNKIVNIQVQFHDFVPDAEKRMKSIQESLKKTHYLTYEYEFVWENWKLKIS